MPEAPPEPEDGIEAGVTTVHPLQAFVAPGDQAGPDHHAPIHHRLLPSQSGRRHAHAPRWRGHSGTRYVRSGPVAIDDHSLRHAAPLGPMHSASCSRTMDCPSGLPSTAMLSATSRSPLPGLVALVAGWRTITAPTRPTSQPTSASARDTPCTRAPTRKRVLDNVVDANNPEELKAYCAAWSAKVSKLDCAEMLERDKGHGTNTDAAIRFAHAAMEQLCNERGGVGMVYLCTDGCSTLGHTSASALKGIIDEHTWVGSKPWRPRLCHAVWQPRATARAHDGQRAQSLGAHAASRVQGTRSIRAPTTTTFKPLSRRSSSRPSWRSAIRPGRSTL